MTNNEYKHRRDYVTSLNKVFNVFPFYERVAYIHVDDKEFIKIWDQIGGAVYLEATKLKLYEIFDSIALCMRGEDPPTRIHDVKIMRYLVPYFKQECLRQDGLSQE